MMEERRIQSDSRAFLSDISSLGIAQILTKTITAPLERLKIIYQAQNSKFAQNERIKSFSDYVTKVSKDQGFKSFFRGNLANLYLLYSQKIVRFTFFDNIKKSLYSKNDKGTDKLLQKLIASVSCGFVSLVFTYPFEVARTKLSLDFGGKNNRDYKGLITIFSHNNKKQITEYPSLHLNIRIDFNFWYTISIDKLKQIINLQNIFCPRKFIYRFLRCNLGYILILFHFYFIGVMNCIKLQWRHQKLAGMYKGFFLANIYSIPNFFILFFGIDALKAIQEQSNENLFWQNFGVVSVAGILSQSLLYPVETLRRRLIGFEDQQKTVMKGSIQYFQHMQKNKESVRSLYNGFLISFSKSLIAVPLQIFIFNELMKFDIQKYVA